MMGQKPKLAVWKLSSCDGCQLSLLNLEEELLDLAGAVEIAWFPEASSEYLPRPYDISLVEGSITTIEQAQEIQDIRNQSKLLIAIGACATAGGIQALRNFADLKDYQNTVYAHPEYVSSLKNSTAASSHIIVDYELKGCPVNKWQLLELINATLFGRRPNIYDRSVCFDCKLKGNPCLMIVENQQCLGPVTHAGCDALCPTFGRACFGCYGSKENANLPAMTKALEARGASKEELQKIYRLFTAGDPAFEKEGTSHDH